VAIPFLKATYRDRDPQRAVLYYLLTDCHALELPDRVELQLAMILSEKPTPITDRRKDIPRKLAKAIHKGLESEPRARFKNANAMRKALVPFV
jgi:serine/threonine-protein kinase